MASYLETIHAQCELLTEDQTRTATLAKTKTAAQWVERLTPLETRLSKLLATIPLEVKNQGLSLETLRTMLLGKWRGHCHPGELGASLRKLGYVRHRNWSKTSGGFTALWFHTPK